MIIPGHWQVTVKTQPETVIVQANAMFTQAVRLLGFTYSQAYLRDPDKKTWSI